MTKTNNEVLNGIVEQIRDITPVSDEVTAYIEASEIGRKIGMIQTELSQLLAGEASIEWYELTDTACRKETDINMWVYETVRAFKGNIPCLTVKEAIEEAGDVREFQELVERKYASLLAENSPEEQAAQEDGTDFKASSRDDFAASTINIVEEHMDRQAAVLSGDTSRADQLITLAISTRDTLKEYEGHINSLETIVHSQKQLMDNQMQNIKRQEAVIAEQKAAIERYEKQLERVNRQYSDMNQTLLRLNSIQTELRMIGEED